MKARMRRCAMGALITSLLLPAANALAVDAPAGEHWIYLGTMSNAGNGLLNYDGEHGSFSTSSMVSGAGAGTRTVVAIELGELLTSLGYGGFDMVSVRDPGTNIYGATSPGPDIDYFVFEHLWDGAEVTYSYEGTYSPHIEDTAEDLATRLTVLDGESNHPAHSHLRIVSLGEEGMVTAAISGLNLPSDPGDPGNPGDPGGGGGDDDDPPVIIGDLRNMPQIGDGVAPARLLLSEFGFSESFEVYVHAVPMPVPAPGAIALLAGAALMARGGRRRTA